MSIFFIENSTTYKNNNKRNNLDIPFWFLVHNFEHLPHILSLCVLCSHGSHCSFWNICAESSNSLAASINLLQRFLTLSIINSWFRWIKAWVLVTCGVLWLDLVFSSIFLHFNLRPLCLKPEPLWTLNTTFLRSRDQPRP